jgi:hypothetical protein
LFGVVYLRTCLRRIEIAKELLVLEIETGNEVLIPI